jgi:hypothetical protein
MRGNRAAPRSLHRTPDSSTTLADHAVAAGLLLTLLPKVALSRLCGLAHLDAAADAPARGPFYRWFARRYGASSTRSTAS